jgi:uncharacterized protein (TIGR02996 family)
LNFSAAQAMSMFFKRRDQLVTAQYGDILHYRGEQCSLFSNPLEPYFQVDQRPNFDFRSTSCWRGYVGTWEIQNDILFLTAIDGSIENKPVELADLFPTSSGQVRADWVTETLRVAKGECIDYIHMGYASTHEQDVFLSVWEGRLVLVELYENQFPEGLTGSEWKHPKRVSSETTSQIDAVFGSDEAAFIRAIRASPEDQTLRLVYADCLEERGDPRGELIRLIVWREELVRSNDQRESASASSTAAAEWVRRMDAVMKHVNHWLWMKLMDYPLPRQGR